MKENYQVLFGQVTQVAPRFTVNKAGEITQAKFVLKVMRRTSGVLDGIPSELHIDNVIIVTRSPDQIQYVYKNIHLHDMVSVYGVLCSLNTNKKSHCEHCGGENVRVGTMLYVRPIYVERFESNVDEVEALNLLKMRSEVSNQNIISGTLCKDPELRTSGQGRESCQYLIAINRKFRIKEDPENKKTDYAMVKTSGRQCRDDMLRLSVNSTVLLRGCIQSRTIIRESECQHCKKKYTWQENVAEIVPYSVEYVKNYKTDTDLIAAGIMPPNSEANQEELSETDNDTIS